MHFITHLTLNGGVLFISGCMLSIVIFELVYNKGGGVVQTGVGLYKESASDAAFTRRGDSFGLYKEQN